MFCPNCGAKLPDNSRFCGSCGRPTSPAAAPAPQYQAPAVQYAPVYAPQPQRAEQPAAAPRRWPAVIGILMVLSLTISLAAYVFYYMYLRYYGASLGGYFLIQTFIALTCSVLAIVLFFTPTRQVPAVTSIPRWIGVLSSLVGIFVLPRGGMSVQQLLTFFLFTLSPVILYTIGTAAKPRTVAIAVIHLALVVFAFVVSCFSYEWRMWQSGSLARTYLLLYIVLNAIAALIAGVGYTIALFCSRRKYYPDKQ